MKKILGGIFLFCSSVILLNFFGFHNAYVVSASPLLIKNFLVPVFGFLLLFSSMVLFVTSTSLGSSSWGALERNISFFETEQGLFYKYLPDGRVQRIKIRGDNFEVQPTQDAIVFIPDWETTKRSIEKGLVPYYIGSNAKGYERNLLQYIHKGRTQFLNKTGKIVQPEKVRDQDKIYMEILDESGQPDFVIPVTRRPTLGYIPFDTSDFRYKKEGIMVHMGNKVTKIAYKNGKVVGK